METAARNTESFKRWGRSYHNDREKMLVFALRRSARRSPAGCRAAVRGGAALQGSGSPRVLLRRAPARSASTTSANNKTGPTTAEAAAAASSLFHLAKQDAARLALATTFGTAAAPGKATAKTARPIPTFSTGTFRVSPRKLVPLARVIRGMTLHEAHVQMKMSKKRPADRVRALLHRVMANLEHNYGRDPGTFIVKQAWVGKGHYLKRIRTHGRARFGIMHRPAAHLKIVVAEKSVDPSKEERDMEKLVRMFRRHNLYVPLRDDQPIRFLHPPWSSKPWKYVTSPKWLDPRNALAKEAR